MRAAFAALALVALVPGPAVAQRAAPAATVGWFDAQAVLDSMPGRREAEGMYQEELGRARALVAAAADTLKQAVDAFGRGQGELTARQREVALLVLRAREVAFEDMVQQLNVLAEQRRRALLDPLRIRVLDAAREVRAARRLALLVERAEAGELSAFDPALDQTAQVLAHLRAREAERRR
ncbi:MAG: OmpH family outer membrane protein [Gemmatimonadales bacterium]|nr:OmpH family outer membrane protein [Gemmatimonadales bacterium]